MGRDENIALVRRHIEEVWNQGKVEACDELYSDDFELRSLWPNPLLPGGKGDREGAKTALQRWLNAFPDMHFTIDHLIADDEKAVTIHTCSGHQSGDFLGRPPTNLPIEVHGILTHQLAGGKITHLWTMFDLLGALQQLGFAPKPGGPPPG
jgi:steroid delta-isomerase-like uncharacterized protein